MFRKTMIAAIAALALAASAQAATTKLRVIGSGHSAGDFATVATSGKAKHVRAAYLRGYGHELVGFAVVACSRGFSIGSQMTDLSSMRSGRMYRLRMPFRGDCTVTASLTGAGRIYLQIIAST